MADIEAQIRGVTEHKPASTTATPQSPQPPVIAARAAYRTRTKRVRRTDGGGDGHHPSKTVTVWLSTALDGLDGHLHRLLCQCFPFFAPKWQYCSWRSRIAACQTVDLAATKLNNLYCDGGIIPCLNGPSNRIEELVGFHVYYESHRTNLGTNNHLRRILPHKTDPVPSHCTPASPTLHLLPVPLAQLPTNCRFLHHAKPFRPQPQAWLFDTTSPTSATIMIIHISKVSPPSPNRNTCNTPRQTATKLLREHARSIRSISFTSPGLGPGRTCGPISDYQDHKYRMDGSGSSACIRCKDAPGSGPEIAHILFGLGLGPASRGIAALSVESSPLPPLTSIACPSLHTLSLLARHLLPLARPPSVAHGPPSPVLALQEASQPLVDRPRVPAPHMSSMSSLLSAAFGHLQDAVGARAPSLDSEGFPLFAFVPEVRPYRGHSKVIATVSPRLAASDGIISRLSFLFPLHSRLIRSRGIGGE
ncbi:hypothetical protein EDB85DRAFT_2251331 [Lactarius pseudohatsudake]|nr:hypothetical protein EDB85DRAFT_2251331 [Lactarius pseudohatsudake]